MWVHNLLAVSNLLGLPAVILLLGKEKYFAACLVGTVIAASILMHLSETKHNLSPAPWLVPWSSLLLNLDRAAAAMNVVYWGSVWVQHRRVFGYVMLYWFIAGALLAAIGEWKSYGPRGELYQQPLMVYLPCHFLWHSIVYYNLYVVASLL